jgi:ribosome-associated toxin RatA of RatAB toxin-antitoxin module
MIKKFAEIKAPLEPLKAMFLDIEAWPHWMPGIRGARIQKRGDNFAEVELRTVYHSTEFLQVMEFRMEGNRFQQRQVSGRFKKWWAEWRFQPSTDATGTFLHVALDIDLGFLGYFLPSRVMDGVLNEWFTNMVQEAEVRHRRQQISTAAKVAKASTGASTLATSPTAPRSAESPLAEAAPQCRIRVFQTAEGLEVCIQDQTYLIPLWHS